MKTLRKRLYEGEHLLGTMVTTFPSPEIAQLLKLCGFDYFIVDCEHSPFSYREVAQMLAAAQHYGIPAMVRIPEVKREPVLKFMEMGASGLLMPNTDNADMARQLVQYAKYAPEGRRGISFVRPHANFGQLPDAPQYLAQTNDETILICQIESREGVRNIDEILAVPGIDVALIGPYDMSQDFGLLGQFDHPELVAAFRRVIEAARSNHKFSGAHLVPPELLKRWIDEGMTMNMWNCDTGLLMDGARTLGALRV